MKTRNGFVSNSSSSSFIVASTEIPVVYLRTEITNGICDQQITSKLELDYYIKTRYEDYNIEEEFWLKKAYDECLAALDEGKTLYICRVSNSDNNIISNLVYEAEASIGNGEVIVYDI